MRQIRCIGRYPRWYFCGDTWTVNGETIPILWDHLQAGRPWYLYDHEGD